MMTMQAVKGLSISGGLSFGWITREEREIDVVKASEKDADDDEESGFNHRSSIREKLFSRATRNALRAAPSGVGAHSCAIMSPDESSTVASHEYSFAMTVVRTTVPVRRSRVSTE
jgi:hypothetical protein